MKTWFSAAELVGMPGLPGSRSQVTRTAQRESWRARERKGRGGGREYHLSSLPQLTQMHLSRLRHPKQDEPQAPSNPDEVWARHARATSKRKKEGERRARILHEIRRAEEAGVPLADAVETAAAQHHVGLRTIYRWRSQVKGLHWSHWMAALVPEPKAGRSKTDCSPEAWAFFKADYLRLEQPAASACYERLCRAAEKEGWDVPSLKTLQRRIRTELPRQLVVLAREGEAAFDRTMPAQRRDHAVYRALEAVNADGHKFDVFVRWPDGSIHRPVMVAWQDIFSAKMLSYRVDQTENVHSVRLSFGDLVERYGIPRHAYLDNGRSFAAKWLTGGSKTRYRFKVKEEEPAGLLTSLGVTIHWATPYHGQAKPIERAFRDLCEHVAKHPAFAGAYTGNNPLAKPENYASRAVDLELFLEVLEEEMRLHNSRIGRRSEVCAGRSFDIVFNESYRQGPVMKASADQRRLWLLAAEAQTAGHDGSVAVAGNRYWSEPLSSIAGQKVVVRFDPDKLHDQVHVYTPGGDYLGEADCVLKVGFDDAEAAKAHAKATRRRKRAMKDQLKAERELTALEAARRLPSAAAEDTPEPAVVQLARPRLTMAEPEPLPEIDEDEREDLFAKALANLRALRALDG